MAACMRISFSQVALLAIQEHSLFSSGCVLSDNTFDILLKCCQIKLEWRVLEEAKMSFNFNLFNIVWANALVVRSADFVT